MLKGEEVSNFFQTNCLKKPNSKFDIMISIRSASNCISNQNPPKWRFLQKIL